MATELEKKLAIQLLKERVERLTGKKVLFKEAVDPKTLKVGQELSAYDEKKKVVRLKFVKAVGNIVVGELIDPFQFSLPGYVPLPTGTIMQFNPASLTAKVTTAPVPPAGAPVAPPVQ
jgi:hypothetical protein